MASQPAPITTTTNTVPHEQSVPAPETAASVYETPVEERPRDGPLAVAEDSMAVEPQTVPTAEPTVSEPAAPTASESAAPTASEPAAPTTSEPTALTTSSEPAATAASPSAPPSPEALGPAAEGPIGAPVAPTTTGPSLTLNLLLTTGARHPYRLDARYLTARKVRQSDPRELSGYQLKELIWTDWRGEWEPRPASPSSIRLIVLGRMLDDKTPLKDYPIALDAPNVVHMTVKPPPAADDDDAAAGKGRGRGRGRFRSNAAAGAAEDAAEEDAGAGCRCVIL